MSLFRVQLTYQTVLVARNPDEARRLALDVSFEPAEISQVDASEITKSDDLPAPWTTNCIPFGGDDETTIHGLLKRR